MKKLRVIYAGWGEHWQLGTLADTGQTLLFEYSAEALAQGLELSPRHLKLRSAAYGDFPEHLMRLPGFVADALPDGWGLLLMDRLLRRQGHDPRRLSPLDRLGFVGHRGMGALVFEPEMDEALEPADVELRVLAEQSQQVLVDVDTQALRQLALMGGSPQGARPKVLVHRNRAAGSMGTTATPDTQAWIIKFQARGEHPETCAVEALYAVLARECGLDMPETGYFDLGGGLSGFGARRFDVHEGLRVPMLTLAGLLHADFRLPQLDYLTFLRATTFLTRDVRETARAFERAVFNVLFHNRDDHGKNFSFRLDAQRRWRLSPAYDLTFNEGAGGEHAMDVGGHGSGIARAHLLALARQADLSAAMATEAIDRMRGVAAGFSAVAGGFAIRQRTVQAMHKRVSANSVLLG